MSNTEVLTVASLRTAKGNVSQEDRNSLADWFAEVSAADSYGQSIADRFDVVEMNVMVAEKPEERGRKEARAVFELDVEKGASRAVLSPFTLGQL